MSEAAKGSAEDCHLSWSDPRTFFLEPDHWCAPYTLRGDDAHHLIKVLRLKPGDEVRLLDGRGNEGVFCIESCGKRDVTLSLLQRIEHPYPSRGIILAAGWTKAARRSWILEKAVELGALGVWFWQGERSQFPVPDDVKDNWRGQLIAGAKQCRNPWLPELRTLPGGIAELSREAETLKPAAKHVLLEEGLAPCRPLTPDLLAKSGATLCVIGPEGGFAPREVRTLQDSGFEPLTLGDRVLRWETAAMLCLGLHWWGGGEGAFK